MDIITALKTGRRVRREGWGNNEHWYDENLSIVKADILADDWEAEQPTVSITREQFDDAWSKAMAEPRNYAQLYLDIVKELGL